MIIKSLTPVQVTAGLAESVSLAIFIKQPMWLRLATVGSCVNLMLAVKTGNKKHRQVAQGIDFVVSSIRVANANKTSQIKKEFGLGLGLNIISVTATAIEEQYLANKVKSDADETSPKPPRKSFYDTFKDSFLEAQAEIRARKEQQLPPA